MTVIEMVDNLKTMMEQANLSFEEAIEKARELRGEDLEEVSMRVQVILDDCQTLQSQLQLVIDQGTEIQNTVGSG
jgi:hypothetical protein